MLSDTLFDIGHALREHINHYSSPEFGYSPSVLNEARDILARIDALRERLDTLPDDSAEESP